ncbi:MAG: hypothetical protein PHI87_05085, partial [Candidatus Methanomethylophilus sp.]|nr:hypothetical protein [Methanomethylophilus sp.]
MTDDPGRRRSTRRSIPQVLEDKLGRNWDRQTKQDKLDRFIKRTFPFFVVIGLVLTVIMTFMDPVGLSFSTLLMSLCWAYIVVFVVIGLISRFLSESEVLSSKYTFLVFIVIATLLAALLWFLFGTAYGLNNFVVGFFTFLTRVTADTSFLSVLVSIYVLTFVVVMVSYGVLAVVVAYFRSNYHRILYSLESPKDGRLKRVATRLFNVPSIIDVTEVTIDPEVDDGHFNKRLFKNLALAQIIVGLTLSSYIFLNPVFLQTIPFDRMLTFMALVSLFLCAIIVPCSILRSLGAEAHSAAPRPYVLWLGMRNRLYQAYFILAITMTLLGISVFTGMDVLRIAITYAGYLVFLVLMSLTVSFIYVNTFYVSFKNGIVRNFLRRKY